jgi:hypothetical protein
MDRQGNEFLGISAKVPSDAVQLENGRSRHRCEVPLVGVLFTVVDELNFHFSPHNFGKGLQGGNHANPQLGVRAHCSPALERCRGFSASGEKAFAKGSIENLP